MVVGTIPSFVGRVDEVAQIAARLQRGAAGRGGFILFLGDAGIGKTALIDESLGSPSVAAAPLFAGLPDDSCQARHWGVVLEGSLIFRLTNGESVTIGAGEAYYIPPGGHTPAFVKGSRVIEFSPTDELAATTAVRRTQRRRNGRGLSGSDQFRQCRASLDSPKRAGA